MGCPVRDVVKKGAGAGLIGNFELADEIINAVKKGAGKIPVSVKTRLGKNENIATKWVAFLLEQDLAALTVHGRIAKQMSKGEVNWKEIGKIVKIRNRIGPETVIIGNGDIKSYEEVGLMHKKYGVDGVMIGRGVFANPWVFDSTVVPHAKEDYIKLLTRHIEFFETTWGSTKNFAVIKKFLKMYVKDFKGANTLRQRIMDAGRFE
ncbi:MAG: tRNA-dihydrouridine synthase [Candidatus Woesebacteria bacterium]|nr:tRNA-dihydrouridine synthase [Candidatus Woesebacteria bacterium]